MTTFDHKAAKEQAERWSKKPASVQTGADLARCYLDLREKARNYLDCIEEGSMTPEVRDALRAILGGT